MEQNLEVEKFLEGRASPEEIEILRKKIQEDEGFAKMVSSEIELKHGIIYAKRMEIIRKLEKLDEQKEANETRSFSFLKIAAGIALLITAGFSIWYFTSSPKVNETFLAYYEPMANIDLPSNRGDDDFEFLFKTDSVYSLGEYHKTIEYADVVSSNPVYKAYADFIKGLAQIELKEYRDAIESFTEALETISPLVEDIKWYRALCYIQLDDAKNAIADLSDLRGAKYSDRATIILSQLNE